MRDRLADAEIGDARLHARRAVLEIDVQHPVHLGDAEHDGVLLRDRAAAERGARAARHHLHPVLVAEAQDGRDLLGRRRQHHRERHLTVGGQPVRLEGPAFVLGDDQGLRRDKASQTLDDLLPARQNRFIRFWKCDGHGILLEESTLH